MTRTIEFDDEQLTALLPVGGLTAEGRLSQATRETALMLKLGRREIELLAAEPWVYLHQIDMAWREPLYKLHYKGLVNIYVNSNGVETTESTEAGALMRHLAILSNHICIADEQRRKAALSAIYLTWLSQQSPKDFVEMLSDNTKEALRKELSKKRRERTP